MDTNWLQYCATEEQLKHFDEQGYLIVEDALEPDMVERPVPEMERPHPRLSLKVSYWLSDVRGEDRGAMRIVPGSHKLDELPAGEEGGDPIGAIEVRVKPGTAVLFDRRMWHSRGWNYSEATRKVVFIGYSYRWLRGLDYNLMPEELLAKCDPIRRQLLGDGVDVKGWPQIGTKPPPGRPRDAQLMFVRKETLHSRREKRVWQNYQK